MKSGKKDLIQEFAKLKNKVSICSDVWSDHWQIHHYMGITCHWVDESFQLQNRLIAYRLFDEAHTAENIAELICQVLSEYGLLKKVFAVGFDNASANTASIEDLKALCQPSLGGMFFHVRCICHILNLCVQDGLKATNDCIAPIRKALEYLWSKPNIMKAWARFCKDNGKTAKKFKRDVGTRWNSTYEMLQASSEYKDLLCLFWTQASLPNKIYAHHWTNCQSLFDLLQVFYTATNTLSGMYYSTTNLVVEQCTNIVLGLATSCHDQNLRRTILLMRLKWLKYFNEFPLLDLIALVLDPRLKFSLLEEILNMYYDALYNDVFLNDPSLPNYVDLNLGPNDTTHLYYKPNVLQICAHVRTTLQNIYHEYASTLTPSNTTTLDTSSSLPPASRNMSAVQRVIMRATSKRPRVGLGGSSSNELEQYIETTYEFTEEEGLELDLLQWWKGKVHRFPVLTLIAKEVLACPVSTVSVERAFSMGGNILSAKRSSLSPDNLEAQCLVNDWTRAAKRQQGQGSDEDQPLDDSGDKIDTGSSTSTGSSVA
jgi:hypothetical protein